MTQKTLLILLFKAKTIVKGDLLIMIAKKFENIGEYCAAGLYEEPNRSLFYRKALGIRRFFEHRTLAPYNGELLYPSGWIPRDLSVFIFHETYFRVNYAELNQKDPELAEIYRKDFAKYSSSVPEKHRVAGNMSSHSMPHYERFLKEGLLSYVDRINKIKDKDMREGLLHVVEGIKNYVFRCVAYLESVNADKKLIDALKKVPLYPAENIFEAILCWNFIFHLDYYDNLGCLADGLLPYYNGEDVTDLLRNLFQNTDDNEGFTLALGKNYNPLTIQCLEASKGLRRPMIELFVDEDTPEEVWEKAFEVIRSSNGQPAFYNAHIIPNDLQKKFPIIRDEDLKTFCGGGCTESMFSGLSNVGAIDAGINLLLILEQVIYEKLTTAKTFDEFYSCYLLETQKVVDTVANEIYNSQKIRAELEPLPLRTLLVDDCIDKGVDFNSGGARYCWSIVNFAGMINVIDSLLVIKDLIFTDKTYTPEQVISSLKANDKNFLSAARNHKRRFGIDDQTVNEFSYKLSSTLASMFDGKKTYYGEGFLPCAIQFESQVEAGKNVGATPDGREAKTPLCDSLTAIFGKDTEGPTALLKSITSLDLKSYLGIPVVNFNINPEFNGKTLKALILGYMQLGGIQMQITCTSLKTLQEAYENPDMHKNLVVRVGGYSEYFQKLPDEMKKMIINRTIQQTV